MRPANIFKIVDLPEPEGPTIANFSPSSNLKFNLLNLIYEKSILYL